MIVEAHHAAARTVQDGVAGSHYTGCAGLTIAAPSKRIEMEILNPAACDSAGGTSIRLSM